MAVPGPVQVVVGMNCKESYVVASGLGLIRRRNLSPGPDEIISTLVEE